LLFRDFVAVKAEREAHQLRNLVMWHGQVAISRFGRLHAAQLVVGYVIGSRVKT
jgi:hypothetical protein